MVEAELREPGIEVANPGAGSVSRAGTAGRVEHRQGEGGDLRDRVFEVRLEIEKVRTEMAGFSDEVSKEFGRVYREFGKVRVEMGEMKIELIDRMNGSEERLRVEITELKKSTGRWMAFAMSFITVLVTLVGLLG